MGKRDFGGIESVVELMKRLLDGQILTAAVVGKALDIQHAAAMRRLKLLATLPGVTREKVDGVMGVKMSTLFAHDTFTPQEVLSACLVSSLGSSLRDTSFRSAVERVRARLVARSRPYHQSADLDRKFWFVARGGESALPDQEPDLVNVIEALLDSRWLQFKYRNLQGVESREHVRPLTLALHEHQFYVIAARENGGPLPVPFLAHEARRVGREVRLPAHHRIRPEDRLSPRLRRAHRQRRRGRRRRSRSLTWELREVRRFPPMARVATHRPRLEDRGRPLPPSPPLPRARPVALVAGS